MAWNIEFERSAQKELNKINLQDAQRIIQFLTERLMRIAEPRSLGQALKGSRFKDLWKYRVGDNRLICQIIDMDIKILVVKVGNRREIYR